MQADPRIDAAAQAWHSAGHGAKGAVVAELAATLGVSVPTAYKRIRAATITPPRRRRRDAGQSALTREEAEAIWLAIRETTRRTGTGALPVQDAVEQLRAAGVVQAAYVDMETGEWRPMSESAVRRGLILHGYGFAEMRATAPAGRLASPRPNWCWQLDASVSTQFYLADGGAEQMDRGVYYDGKPGNLVKINSQRIWRYAITDHASGCIELFYAQGAESAANAVAALIHAMTERAGGTMHGVPKYLMSDPGSGFTAAAVANFCAALGITHLPHAPGSARVTGQVEKAHHLIERHFEATLKLRAPVTTIAEINGLAQAWARSYNATRTHTRTGMTRRDGWLRIKPAELVRAPSIEVLRQLPNSTPKTCTVRDGFIRFGGAVYDVRELPGGAVNGRRVQVVRNALDGEQTVRVVLAGDDGQDAHFLAARVERDEYGFLATAAQIGTEYKAAPETPADARAKAIERLAMDAATDEEAKAARKARRLAFGGQIDPAKPWREARIPEALPRASVASQVAAPAIAAPEPVIPTIRPQYVPVPLTHAEMARGLKRLVEARGGAWSAVLYARMAETWPEGVPEEGLEQCAVVLMRASLRSVGGGAA